MSRQAEHVTVLANGIETRRWLHVQVRASLYSAASNFGLEMTEDIRGKTLSVLSGGYAFPPGTELEIYAGTDLMTKGYVNVYAPTIDPKNHSVQIEGRSRAQDWIDSSAVHDRGEWLNKTPLEIARDLDEPFGIGVTADVELEPVETFHIYQGETVLQALERLLRDQGVTLMSQPDGSVLITNASVAGRHKGKGLIEGWNTTKMAARLTDMHRHDEYIVKGQRGRGTKDVDLRVKQAFKDRGMRRFRPKILIHEGDTNPSRADRRAQWEAERRMGFSVRATVIVQGWRDDEVQLWSPRRLVYVESPSLKIFGDLLIESVDFSQVGTGYSRGTQTEIGLVHPAAYKGKPGKVNKTAPEWGNVMLPQPHD